MACADRDAAAAEETARLVEAGGRRGAGRRRRRRRRGARARASSTSRSTRSAGSTGWCATSGSARAAGSPDTSVAEWDVVHAVNVRAHFLLCRAALPRMTDGGAIVFISSIAGLRPGTRIPAYDTTKAALGGLCRHVAFEGARQGVRANIVAPGLIDTPLGRRADRGPPEPRPHAGAARPPGNGVGGRGAGRVPVERRRELHHRPDDRRRRRPLDAVKS